MTGPSYDARSRIRCDLLEQRFGGTVRGLYASRTFEALPLPIGSCVLLDSAGKTFLVTAGHVADEVAGRHLFAAGDSEFVLVDGEFLRSDSILDLAVLPIADATHRRITATDPVKVADISFDIETPGQEPVVMIAMGFPAVYDDRTISNDGSASIRAKLVRIPGPARFASVAHHGLSSETHLAMGFNRQQTFVDGTLQSAPKINGMSGCGIWRFDRFFEEPPPQESAKLVGVAIRAIDRTKLLIGTRVAEVLRLVAES